MNTPVLDICHDNNRIPEFELKLIFEGQEQPDWHVFEIREDVRDLWIQTGIGDKGVVTLEKDLVHFDVDSNIQSLYERLVEYLINNGAEIYD